MGASADNRARFREASDRSLLVSFGDKVAPEINQEVQKLLHLLQSQPIDGIRNLQPAYCSLLIQFDLLKMDHGELRLKLGPYVARLEEVRLPQSREIEIPVCYGGEFGPDLEDVAAMHGVTAERVVELHSGPSYLVYFLGFVPGFAYLGGLPEKLASPRLETPRTRVPEGSVAIGGGQTGVYPFATPGGWRLIGRTNVAMFRRDKQPMNLLQIGDRVRFRAISKEEFAASGDR